MKKNKLKIFTIILLIVLVTIIGFFGIYTKSSNTMKQSVKDYQYAMDLEGKRVVTLKLAEDNDEESKNKDNYKLTKDIIEKRLNSLGASDYAIRLDEETGKIIVELADNDNTDNLVSNLSTVGKLEIVDSDTKEVLLNNDDIKTSQVLRSTTTTGTSIYFSIEFNEEGKKKLEEITKTYVPAEETAEQQEETTTEDEQLTTETDVQTEEQTEEQTEAETDAETEESTTNKEKTITMKLDDEDMMTTSFEEPITDGKMNLTVGQASTDTETLNENLNQARNMSALLSNKNLPLKYELDGNIYVASPVKDTITNTVISCVECVMLVTALILIIKYKSKGFLATLAYIGFTALLLIIIRYWNVVISTEGVAALIAVLILNFILSNKILEKINKEKDNKKIELKQVINSSIKDFTLKVIPLLIIAIVFTFINLASASSFGMVMFWGLALIEIYNLLITKNLLKYNKQN